MLPGMERKPENLPMPLIWEVKVLHWDLCCSMDKMVVKIPTGYSIMPHLCRFPNSMLYTL